MTQPTSEADQQREFKHRANVRAESAEARLEALREAANLAVGFLDALAAQPHGNGLEILAVAAATHRDRLRAAVEKKVDSA